MSVMVESRIEARAAVLVSTAVIANEQLEALDDVVRALEGLEYEALVAERLVLLVPLAFGRVALKARGVEHFAWTVRVEAADGEILRYALEEEPVFLEALRHAVESFEGRGVDEATFARLAHNSAEMGAAVKAEGAGQDVRQARIHETVWRSRLPSARWQAAGAERVA